MLVDVCGVAVVDLELVKVSRVFVPTQLKLESCGKAPYLAQRETLNTLDSEPTFGSVQPEILGSYECEEFTISVVILEFLLVQHRL